jgi:glycogen synthase
MLPAAGHLPVTRLVLDTVPGWQNLCNLPQAAIIHCQDWQSASAALLMAFDF